MCPLQNKEQLKVMVEPYMEPVMHSMPFNLTEFAGRYNLSMPDMFQSEQSPRPGLELAKQVAPQNPQDHVNMLLSMWGCHS